MLKRMGLMVASAGVAAVSLPAAGHAAQPCPKVMNLSGVAGPGAQYARPRVSVSCSRSTVTIRSNGLPHYRFVQITPNPLVAQNFVFRFPRNPRRAARPTRLPLLGPAGVAVNGVVFFGPNEAQRPRATAWGDPVYNSIMDRCMGHTAWAYHYHAFVQKCLAPASRPGRPSPILGYAFDGFPIYGSWGCLDKACRKVVKFRSGYRKVGNPSTNAWQAFRYVASNDPTVLDRCNGRVGPDGRYRYHVTSTFPYIIGCYTGTPTSNRTGPGFGARRGPPNGGPRFGMRRPGPGFGPPNGRPFGPPPRGDRAGRQQTEVRGCTLTAAGTVSC